MQFLYAIKYRFDKSKEAQFSGFGYGGFIGVKESDYLDATEMADDEIKAEYQALRRLREKYKKFMKENDISDIEIISVKKLNS